MNIFERLITECMEKVRFKGYSFRTFEYNISALKSRILQEQSYEWRFIKSHLLNFSFMHRDLFDIAIFNHLGNIRIIFQYELEYLNAFTGNTDSSNTTNSLEINVSGCFWPGEGYYFLPVNIIGSTDNQLCKSHDSILFSLKTHMLEYLIRQNMGIIDPIALKTDVDSIKAFMNMHNLQNCSKIEFNDVLSDNLYDSNTRDLEEFKPTLQDVSLVYDIDGISAFAYQREIIGIKSIIKLEYSTNSVKQIISKNVHVNYLGCLYDIKSFFAFKMGSIPISDTSHLDVFMVIPKLTDYLPEDKKCTMTRSINEELSTEIDIFIKDPRMAHYHSLIRKSGNNTDSLSIKATVDNLFFADLLMRIARSLKMNAFYFIEGYNMKHDIVSPNPSTLLSLLANIFDMSRLCPKIDLCVNVILINRGAKTLCMKNGFLKKHSGVQQYTLLNCTNISNFHGYLSKTDKNRNNLHIYSNGIEKLNLYTPVINFLLPRHMRIKKYPTFTATLLGSALYGWAPDNKTARHLKIIKRHIAEVDSAFRNAIDISIGIRAEFKIPAYNFISCLEFAHSFIIGNSYFLVKTQKIKELLIDGLQRILNITENSNQAYNLEDLANFALTEQSFFEYYIRGGKNLNILPKRVREFIGTHSTEYTINPMPPLINFYLENLERMAMIHKLIKYNRLFSGDTKKNIFKLFEIIGNTNESLLSKIVDLYKSFILNSCSIPEAVLTLGSGKFARKLADPISFSHFFTEQFITPPSKITHTLHIGLFKYYIFNNPNFDLNTIAEEFKSKSILYFPKREGSRIIDRRIIYNSEPTTLDIDQLVCEIKDSIIFGFSDSSIPKYKNNNPSVRARAPDVSVSELTLLYYAFHKDASILNQRSKLYNDLRYPFKLYCTISRITTGARTLTAKLERGAEYNITLKNFNISEFSVLNLILFLNINQRSFKTAQSIKDSEKLLDFINDRQHIEKPLSYYQLLYSNQRDLSKDQYAYLVLFGGCREAVSSMVKEPSCTSIQRYSSPQNVPGVTEELLLYENNEFDETQYYNTPGILTISPASTANVGGIIQNRQTEYISNTRSNLDNTRDVSSDCTIELLSDSYNSFNNEIDVLSTPPTGISFSPNLSLLREHHVDMSILMLPVVENKNNNLYKITDDKLVLTPKAQQLIEIIKLSVKKKFIVLQLLKKRIEEKRYKYEEVIELFEVMEKYGQIIRKPKNDIFIFKFID